MESTHKSKSGVQRIWRAAFYSFEGFRSALKHEHAFRQELMLCALLLPLAIWLPLVTTERVLLIATLLMDLVRRHAPAADVAALRFKAVRPTFDLHPFSVNGETQTDGKTVTLWAQDHEGWLTMDAVATLKG